MLAAGAVLPVGAAAVLAGLAASAAVGTAAGAAVTGSFAVTGSLSVARTDATTTLLSGGDVLVAGGQDASGTPLADAEVYHPSTGQWTTTAPLPLPVSQAAAVLLRNGDVLVAGGLTLSSGSIVPTAAAELYDPATGTWVGTAPLLAPACDESAVLLPASGDVLEAGGFTGSGNNTATAASSELYDPNAGKWAATVSQPSLGVADGAMAALSNGEVLLAGGVSQSAGGSPSVTNLSQLFQPATGVWSATDTMPAGVADATATVLGDNRVLVAGGESSAAGTASGATQLFDPSTDAWSSGGALPAPSFGATASLLTDGDVLYAGGLTDGSGDSTAAAALFTPSTNQWTATGTMQLARGHAGAAALTNGNALVAGGSVGSSVTGESELYAISAPTVAPAITSPATADVEQGVKTTITITTSGSPTPSLSESGTLPPGLSFTANANGTATISGTPGASGTGQYQVTVVATNGVGNPAVQQLVLDYTSPPSITTAAVLNARANSHVGFTIRASGVPKPTIGELGALPAGLGFKAAGAGSATLSGTPAPSAVGTHQIELVASNGVGTQAVQYLSIVVTAAAQPAVVASGLGYWYAMANGQVTSKGAAAPIAASTPQHPRSIVAMAVTPDRGGYYLVSSFGGVFNYGDAKFFGSLAHQHLGSPAVAFAVTPSGNGYYLVTRFGQVYPFGDARYYGSPANLHVAPTTAFGVAQHDAGYWVVTSKGNVFNYGAARFAGSTAHRPVPAVTAFAQTSDGAGYWLVTVKGNVYAFGDVPYYGSLADRAVPPVIAFAPTLDDQGYWVATSKGNVFNFGDARFFGSSAHDTLPSAISAFAAEF